jgi:hypothetical protein
MQRIFNRGEVYPALAARLSVPAILVTGDLVLLGVRTTPGTESSSVPGKTHSSEAILPRGTSGSLYGGGFYRLLR